MKFLGYLQFSMFSPSGGNPDFPQKHCTYIDLKCSAMTIPEATLPIASLGTLSGHVRVYSTSNTLHTDAW